MSTTVVQVDTIQIVYSDNTRTPLIGPDSPDDEYTYPAWIWDERVWTDEYFENSEHAIPVLGDSDTRGIPETYWQSGVGDDNVDLEVLDILNLRQESQERWTAKIRHGNYYKFYKHRYLFADRSQIEFVDYADNDSSRNILQLSEMPRLGSQIIATMWTRNSLDEPVLYKSFQKRAQFTGLYDDSGEQDTLDSNGDIIWSAVDTSYKEFVVKWTGDKTTPPKLYFNQDYTFLFGRTTISDEDDLEFCDFLGEGEGPDENQILYTKYFPIHDNSELKLYKKVGAVITEMVRWTSGYTPPPDPEYVIDCDTGEVTFPEYVNDVATNITPPAVNTLIYAIYRPKIEVEYEPEYCNNYLTAPYIDINPMSSSTNKGFVYLTERQLRVAYITLTADSTLITDNTYGPLYLGSDYCFLIATAYNNHGQPVPGAEISFYLDDTDDGNINGSPALVGSPILVTTDSNGQARVVYTTPRSIESVGQYLTHESGAEAQYELNLIHTHGITSEYLDGLFVYQVFADDGMQAWVASGAPAGEEPGSGGRKVVLYRKTIASETGGGEAESTDRFAGDSDDLHPRSGLDGGSVDVWMPLRPTEISGTTLTFKDSGGSTVDLPWTQSYTGNPGNLVAYWISSGKQISAHARCFSYLYNNYVYSNDIEFRVDIPTHLTGIHITSASKEVPYGFRIYDDNSIVSSGIDGATFLSINPRSGKWPIVWDGSELSGRSEEGNPFNVLGHRFTVTV